MKICFEVTIEDIIAWSLYHLEHSPSERQTRRKLLRVGPILFIAAFSLAFIWMWSNGMNDEDLVMVLGIFIPACLILCALWIVRMPDRMRDGCARRYRRLYSEGSTTGLVGFRELELTETALASRSASGEAYYRLSVIDKICSNEDYTFILLNAITAIVIPHDAIAAGNVTAFIKELERRISVDRA
ncbi:MAG TPA: YcxB family protein [Gemmata sp.]|nr:YcxB family protein [Gemmata sp.]